MQQTSSTFYKAVNVTSITVRWQPHAACAISSLQVITHLWKGGILRHGWEVKWLEMQKNNSSHHAFQLRDLLFQYLRNRQAWNNQLLFWKLTKLIKHLHSSQTAQKGFFADIWISQFSTLKEKKKAHKDTNQPGFLLKQWLCGQCLQGSFPGPCP